MNTSKICKTGFLLFSVGCSAMNVVAQDTTKKKTIEITSSFKPVLREAVKINFNAAPPVVDTSKPRLNYTIPSQNLMFNYQPVPLNPVALQIDSVASWQSANYIKVGVGNVHIPFVQAGFSFGDSKTSFFNIFAKHYTSKGNLPFQKNSSTSVGITGTKKTANNLEWNGKLGFNADDYFLYGYKPATLVFSKDQLRQRFQTIEGQLNLRNLVPTEFGLSYYPNIKVSAFSWKNDQSKATEVNTVLNLPLRKSFGDNFAFDLGFTADLTNLRPDGNGKSTVQNNIYYVSPGLSYKSSNLYVYGGLIPSWDKKKFHLLPNVMADITTTNQQFTLQLGWIGYYDKGSFQRFASINPWLAQPDSLLNTRAVEFYGGIKGSLPNHFTYNAKVGFTQYHDMPLFINDNVDGKTFKTGYSSTLDAFKIHGEVGYTVSEKFNASAGLTMQQFSKVKGFDKAYGLIPFEMDARLNWQVIKDLWLTSKFFMWEGAYYRDYQTLQSLKSKDAFDMSAGVEFRITRQFNLWLQMNNIFNKKYERWNQYQVYGFNILGGIVFSFNQK